MALGAHHLSWRTKVNYIGITTRYEVWILFELDVSWCRTYVVFDTDIIPTHIIILNYMIFFEIINGVSVLVSVSISVFHNQLI